MTADELLDPARPWSVYVGGAGHPTFLRQNNADGHEVRFWRPSLTAPSEREYMIVTISAEAATLLAGES